MGYADHLKATLKPLRLYVLDGGISAAELDSCGKELDELYEFLCKTENNMLPLTADADGLELFESMLPYIPGTGSLAERRAAVMALMRADLSVVTPEKLNRALAVMGAEVSETETPGKVLVSFADDAQNTELWSAVIQRIMPCHLEVEFDG